MGPEIEVHHHEVATRGSGRKFNVGAVITLTKPADEVQILNTPSQKNVGALANGQNADFFNAEPSSATMHKRHATCINSLARRLECPFFFFIFFFFFLPAT